MYEEKAFLKSSASSTAKSDISRSPTSPRFMMGIKAEWAKPKNAMPKGIKIVRASFCFWSGEPAPSTVPTSWYTEKIIAPTTNKKQIQKNV
jgi:hypothetical protein